MSVENIGSIKDILSNYKTNDWSKSANIKLKNSEEFPGDSNLNKLKSQDPSFSDLLIQSVSKVNTLQHQANTAVEKLVSGETKNIHETMLAVERADIAFKTMNQIRSKVVEAYKEIMRMQV